MAAFKALLNDSRLTVREIPLELDIEEATEHKMLTEILKNERFYAQFNPKLFLKNHERENK